LDKNDIRQNEEDKTCVVLSAWSELLPANRLINDAFSLDELLEKLKPYSGELPTFKHVSFVMLLSVCQEVLLR